MSAAGPLLQRVGHDRLRLVAVPGLTWGSLAVHACVLGVSGWMAWTVGTAPRAEALARAALVVIALLPVAIVSGPALLLQTGVELDRRQRTLRTWTCLHLWPALRIERLEHLAADVEVVVRPGYRRRRRIRLEPSSHRDLNVVGLVGPACVTLGRELARFLGVSCRSIPAPPGSDAAPPPPSSR